MGLDKETARLKIEQASAAKHKSVAFQAETVAGERLTELRAVVTEKMDLQHIANLAADKLWQKYVVLSSEYGKKLDALREQNQTLQGLIAQATERIIEAQHKGDKVIARKQTDIRQRHKLDARKCQNRIKVLSSEICSAKEKYDEAKLVQQAAEAVTDQIKIDYDKAKASHLSAITDFQRATVRFERTVIALNSRLTVLNNQYSNHLHRENYATRTQSAHKPEQFSNV